MTQENEEIPEIEIVLDDLDDSLAKAEADKTAYNGDVGEIDSTAMQKEEEDDKVAAEKKTGRKRGNNAQKAINEIWKQREQAQAILAERNRQLQSETIARINSQKAAAGIASEAIDTKLEAINYKLAIANERGGDNYAEKSQLEAERAALFAQKSEVVRIRRELENVNIPQIEQEEVVNKQAAPIVDDETEFDRLYNTAPAPTRKWLDNNKDWADEKSPTYDADKAQDVITYAGNLERKLAQEGRSEVIGTKAYFKALDAYIKENWDSDDLVDTKQPTQEAPVFNKNKSASLPVGGRGVGAGNQSAASNSIKLTQSEVNYALSQPYRVGNRDMTDKEKMVHYYKLKNMAPTSGPISANTLIGRK